MRHGSGSDDSSNKVKVSTLVLSSGTMSTSECGTGRARLLSGAGDGTTNNRYLGVLPARTIKEQPSSSTKQPSSGSYIWDKQIHSILSAGSFNFPLPLWVSNKGPSPDPNTLSYFIACVMQPMLIIENRVLMCQYFSPTSDATPVWSDLETKGFQQQRFFVTSSPVPRIIDSRSKSKLQQVNCYTWFSPTFVCIHIHIFRRIGGNTSAQHQNAKFRMFIRSSKQPKRKSRVSYYY